MGFLDSVVDFVHDVGDFIQDALGIEEQEVDNSVELNKASANDYLPVIYGTRGNIGGTRVFLNASGSKNENLHLVLTQCQGPVHSITNPLLDDESPVDRDMWVDTQENGSFIVDSWLGRMVPHLGAWDQPADSFFVDELAGTNLWGENHRLAGVAYVAARYIFHSEKMGSLPSITTTIAGRLLYDPRTGETQYSTNAALVILDYLRNAVYGERVPDNEIDFESFKVAADICDREVPNYDGAYGTYRPLDINAVIDTDKSRLDNMQDLLKHARAVLPYVGGQYRIAIRAQTASSFTFDDDVISGSISIESTGANDKINRVTVTYTDPDLNWDTNSVVYPTDDAEYQQYLAQDNGIESHESVSADMITNKYQALDFGRQYLLESRHGMMISFNALPAARDVVPGDVVTVMSSDLEAYLFFVEKRTLSPNGSFKFTLKEYVPSIYSWINDAELPDSATPSVPSPFNLPAPTSLVFTPNDYNGTHIGELTWLPSASAFVNRYRIDIYDVNTDALAWSSETPATRVKVPLLSDGVYRVELAGKSDLSSTPVVTILFTNGVAALSAIAGLHQVGEFNDSLMLAWLPATNLHAFRDYLIEIVDVETRYVIYSKNSSNESVMFSLSEFAEMNYPRSFEVRVSPVNINGLVGEGATLAISKPAPAAPTFTISAESDALHFTFVRPVNATGVGLWLSDVEPIAVNDSTQIYRGEALTASAPSLLSEVVYYIAVASYDSFGFGAFAYDDAQTLLDAVQRALDTLNDRDLSIEHDIEQINIDQQARWLSIDSNQQASRAQMLDSALKAAQFKQEVAARDDDFATIINAVVSIDPETGTITNSAYQYADTKFSEASLRIEGVQGEIDLQTQNLEVTEQRLTDAEAQLEIQAGVINSRVTYTELSETVAGAIAAIQPAYATNFNVSLDGWSSESGTATYNAGQWVDLTLGDISAVMDYSGADNPVVQLVIARDPSAVWVGKLRWSTSDHGFTSAHEMDINKITDDGQQYTVTVDLGDNADYSSSQITGLHIMLGATTADVYRIHSVQAGKRTAAQAAIEGIQGRVSSAEQSISALNGQLTNYVTTAWYEENGVTISDVQSELDSFNSTYSVVATLQQLANDGTIEKANTAQQWINGAEALISQIAQAEAGKSVTQVRQDLDAANGTIEQSITAVNQLKRTALQTALDAAKAAREGEQTNDSVAVVNAKSEATATDLAVQAQRTEQLSVEFNEQQAAYEDQVKVFADDISAQAQRTESLESEYGENKAIVQDRLDTLASDVVVQAQRTTTLQSNFNSSKAEVQQQIETLTSADQAFAQSLETLDSAVGDNVSAFDEYKRTAIGYCVDANGNPTSHETAAACSLAGNTWRGNMPISEAIRRGRITVTDPQTGQQYNAQVANILQTALNAEGRATATASILATVADQLAGVFINVGQNGSEIIARSDRFKILTAGGSKQPFRVNGSTVTMQNIVVENADFTGVVKAAVIEPSQTVVRSVVNNTTGMITAREKLSGSFPYGNTSSDYYMGQVHLPGGAVSASGGYFKVCNIGGRLELNGWMRAKQPLNFDIQYSVDEGAWIVLDETEDFEEQVRLFGGSNIGNDTIVTGSMFILTIDIWRYCSPSNRNIRFRFRNRNPNYSFLQSFAINVSYNNL